MVFQRTTWPITQPSVAAASRGNCLETQRFGKNLAVFVASLPKNSLADSWNKVNLDKIRKLCFKILPHPLQFLFHSQVKALCRRLWVLFKFSIDTQAWIDYINSRYVYTSCFVRQVWTPHKVPSLSIFTHHWQMFQFVFFLCRHSMASWWY